MTEDIRHAPSGKRIWLACHLSFQGMDSCMTNQTGRAAKYLKAYHLKAYLLAELQAGPHLPSVWYSGRAIDDLHEVDPIRLGRKVLVRRTALEVGLGLLMRHAIQHRKEAVMVHQPPQLQHGPLLLKVLFAEQCEANWS